MNRHILFLPALLAILIFGCHEAPPTSPTPDVQATQSLRQRIHGTWFTLSDLAVAPILVFDTVSGQYHQKIDYGFGIRKSFSYPFEIDSLRIWQEFYDGTKSVAYWYRWQGDSVFLSTDSNFTFVRLLYGRLSSDVMFSNWVEPAHLDIGPQIWSWTEKTSWGFGLAYADSTWIVLSQNDSSEIYPRLLTLFTHPWGPFLGTYQTTALAIDAEPGFLWTCDRSTIRKYTLPSLQLITSIDASVLQAGGSSKYILGMAVSDSLIFVNTMTPVAPQPVGAMHTFSKSGDWLGVRTSSSSIWDMAWANGRLWAADGSNFYELDPQTFEAVRSFEVVIPPNELEYTGSFGGIAVYENSLGMLNQLLRYWHLTRVILPTHH